MKKSRKIGNENQSSFGRNASSNYKNEFTSSRSNDLRESENRNSNRQDIKPPKQINIYVTDTEGKHSNYLTRNQFSLQNSQNEDNKHAYSSLILKEEKDK
jgi:hypothetical protein